MKIKDIRLSKIKLVEYLGEVEPAWSPGSKVKSNIGGTDFVEIELDNGEIGIGPGCDPTILNDSKEYLIGKNPTDVIDHFKYLTYKTRNIPYRGLAGIDIALWDLKGKVENKSISEILGRKKNHLIPYASLVILSDPEERGEMAKKLFDQYHFIRFSEIRCKNLVKIYSRADIVTLQILPVPDKVVYSRFKCCIGQHIYEPAIHIIYLQYNVGHGR